MSSSRLIAMAIGVSLASAMPVAAGEDANPPPLIHTIELWLAANFALEPAKSPPVLVKVTPSELVEIRYGPGSQVPPGYVLGAYDDDARIIYLAESWNGRTPEQLSVLVHEIVHHLQASHDLRFACPAEREKVAYAAQDAWLKLFGSDLKSAFGIDAASLLIATACTH